MAAESLAWLGRAVLNLFEQTGQFMLLLARAARWMARGVLEPRQTILQMGRVGVESLPVALVTGTFAGMVLAFQTAQQLSRFGVPSLAGGAVAVSLAREAAPVFTGVTLAGRVGAGFAAELGAMAVTEQIDALRALATDPVRYLVVPRLLAGIAMLPVLTVFANLAGTLGGLVVAALAGVEPATYLSGVQRFLTPHDYTSGLAKAAVFGGIIALVGSHQGLRAEGGAAGVGRATTEAVVEAIVLILVWNYFLDIILF